MSDSVGPAIGGYKPEDSMVFSLPTPCAILDRTGSVVSTNVAWSNRRSSTGIWASSGENLIDLLSVMPLGGLAAQGLRELLGGHRADFTADVCSEDGNCIRLFGCVDSAKRIFLLAVEIADDPTAQHQYESDRRFQLIVEAAMDGIITVDEREQVVMFNGAAERIFGVTASEAIGGSLSRFLPSRVHSSHGHSMRNFGKTGVSSRSMGHLGTIGGIRADGTEFPMEASISHVQVGARQYFTVILRDISERKHLESQLLQAQKMEGVGRLAGGIAHDFNNLLMAIFNYLALASRKLGPEHPVAPSLAQAQRAAERAADLTRQLLTFARKQVVVPRVLSPRDVALGLTSMLRRLIGEDITLHSALDEDTGNVRADAAQLEQVMVNLAINARDAMTGSGTLTIETRNERLDESYCRTRLDAVPGEYVVIAVSDTGTGMTPEVQARLFEPFFTTKPPGKGTGLGLATCHGIVKQSGGHIGVYSEFGHGTSIRVYLPRVYSEVSANLDNANVAQPPPRGTETILLAEDSGLVRELVADGLRGAGYTVLEASSGAEALRIIDTCGQKIHLLLTDVVMPGMSGVQLAEAVHKKLAIPVIYMSGYTQETISHHGVNPAEVTFIAKPFMSDTLLHLIHRELKKTKTN